LTPSADQPIRAADPLHELRELLKAEEGMEKGLNALSELALGKEALAESIIGRLASDKDLAPDLGGCKVNQDERTVLNLWGVTLCVMRGLPNVSNEEKHAFLDQYHEFIYFMCCPDDEGARLAWAVTVDRISALSQTRYLEYQNAFDEMMRRQETVHGDPSLHLATGAPLMHTITKNLFSLESDSLRLAFSAQHLVMNQLITFAKTFGTEEAWATMRHFMEGACRALPKGRDKFLR
jgi:hypothetical protein